MKAVFIVFSPSGHTLIAARKFMHLLEDNGISCHMINITKNDKYLQDFTITKTLVNDLGEHHLLIPCAPVYASSGKACVIAVSIKPGAIELSRMPFLLIFWPTFLAKMI